MPFPATFDFVIPATAKPRDAVLLFLATADTNTGPDYVALGPRWAELAKLTASGQTVWILRREVLEGDAGAVAIPFLTAIDSSSLGVLAVVRGLNLGAPVVGSSVANIVATINFSSPARVLTTYSDLYLGVTLVDTGTVAVTIPAGTVQVATLSGNGMTLSVWAYFHETTGSTGGKTASTVANQSGLAASIALAADPVVGFGKSFIVEPIGTFGLPSQGV